MKYSYEVVAKAISIADKKIDDTLKPILNKFDTETKSIVNELCVSCMFKSEEEKTKLIEKFEETKNKRNNSEYSQYIDMYYEIDDGFFDVHYNIYRLRFVNEQKRKIIQNIIIEL